MGGNLEKDAREYRLVIEYRNGKTYIRKQYAKKLENKIIGSRLNDLF